MSKALTPQQELVAALADFVREHMPWPFIDVSRHDDEATDAAWEIARRLAPRMEAEFAGIAESRGR